MSTAADDRAILFEKQRLRLRRTLQNLAPPPPENEPPTTNIEFKTTTHQTPPKKAHYDVGTRNQKYALRNTSPPPKSPSGSPHKSSPGDIHGVSKMHIGELGGDIDSYRDDESAVSSLNTAPSKKKGSKKKSTLPTYAWESSAEENNPRNGDRVGGQERIFTAEHGAFIPSSTPGIYMAEDPSDESSTVGSEMGETDPLQSEKSVSGYPSTHLDIQVRW